ncbi:MAG: tetratricopeptide repeat protein [bacterium]
MFLGWGCGASRETANLEGDEIKLDDLLSEEYTDKSEKDSEEAEVLRLLGITPAENATQQTETVPEPELISSNKEVNDLEQELQQKDQEISELRTELTQKESKISELEEQVRSAESRPAFKPTGNFTGPSSEFKSKYQYALNQFNARNYQEALTLFSELLLSDPNNSLSDNCQYWIGESYYGLTNYNQAIAEFEKVFSFPNSNKSDDAQLKLGICYLKLGDSQQARAEFERLISNFPDSEYLTLAQRYIGRL